MRSISLCLYQAALGVLLLSSAATLAQPALPAYTLERYDKPLDSFSIDSNGRDTIVVYGNELNLANTTIAAIRRNRQRAQDIIIVAKSLEIGPDTRFEMTGQTAYETLDSLRGGDVYLVADTLTVNGLSKGNLVSPVIFDQNGGYNPSDLQRLRGRGGRNYVFVNRVVVKDEFSRARVKALNVSSQTNTPVSPAVLKIVSKGFSPANSINHVLAAGVPLLWSGFGDAYEAWLAEEPVSALAMRELNLIQQRTDPFTGSNLPDIVAPMIDAIKYIPSEILTPWYVLYLERNATVAQVAISQKDYDLALESIRNTRPIIESAPTPALTSPEFKRAIADLQEVGNTLAQESVVEDLTFPVDGGAPVRVTVIRDLAEGRVSVVPHQVLLSAVMEGNVVRVGFMTQIDGDVKVSMLGRLVVDPSVLELVRAKFPKPTTEVRVADDLVFDTLNLGLGGALKNGKAQVLGGDIVSFELLLEGTQYSQAVLRLAQPFGVDATVNWKHQRLNLGNQTTRVNVALGRTEMTMMGKEGVLTNSTSQAVDVDYVLDGSSLVVKGFPVRVEAGKSITPGCATALCYAPGSAIRRVLAPSELYTWLVSTPAGSSVVIYNFENQLEDTPSMGRFQQLVLDVTYSAAPGAAPQRTGTFTLGRRGSATAKRSWSFIGPTAGGAKLEISGRAHWHQGYYDIPPKTVESNVTVIDTSWLNPPHP